MSDYSTDPKWRQIVSGLSKKADDEHVEGAGWSADVTQYSNKGPMVIISDAEGGEIFRATLDLFTKQYSVRSKFSPR